MAESAGYVISTKLSIDFVRVQCDAVCGNHVAQELDDFTPQAGVVRRQLQDEFRCPLKEVSYVENVLRTRRQEDHDTLQRRAGESHRISRH